MFLVNIVGPVNEILKYSNLINAMVSKGETFFFAPGNGVKGGIQGSADVGEVGGEQLTPLRFHRSYCLFIGIQENLQKSNSQTFQVYGSSCLLSFF
jgi:hypothetical protein